MKIEDISKEGIKPAAYDVADIKDEEYEDEDEIETTPCGCTLFSCLECGSYHACNC